MKLILYGHTKFKDDSVPLSLTPLVRGNNQCSMVMISMGKVVVFCIVMLMCVY